MRKFKASREGKDTLTQKAYDILKAAILRGEIEEGRFLSEREARRRFGIGRTPFREASYRLHHEQLLKVVPRRGCLVPEMSFREVQQMLEVRQILEGAITEIAAVRGTPEQIDELARLESQPLISGHEGYLQRIDINKDFHLCLARMTQNRELVRLGRGILERAARLVFMASRWFPDRADDFQMFHGPILEAIRRRDPAAARRAVLYDISQSPLGATPGTAKANVTQPQPDNVVTSISA